MNKFLTSQFEENESLIHIESRIDFNNDEDVKDADVYKLLSGHIQLPQIQHKLKVLNRRTTIATFRIPIEHVVSHISWVRKLGEPSERPRLLQHNVTVQKIVAKLVETNLADPEEIRDFTVWLEDENIYLFHDTQTRYLCGGPAGYLKPEQINQALIHLNQLDFVGIVERLDEFMVMLSHKLQWALKKDSIVSENINNGIFGLDINNKEILQALQPFIQCDQMIYRVARERFVDNMHNLLAELEKSKWPRYSTVRTQLLINELME